MGNGVSIDEFRAAPAGRWDSGPAVPGKAKSGSHLKKVGDHRWNWIADKTKIADEQSRVVREALCNTLLKASQEALERKDVGELLAKFDNMVVRRTKPGNASPRTVAASATGAGKCWSARSV